MKVRWTSDSLRLRITPRELAMLEHGEVVSVQLALPGGRGAWSVLLHARGDRGLEATFDSSGVIVRMAPRDLGALMDDQTEGVYAHQPGFRLMVEKDFPCAHAHAADAREPETERFAPTAAYLARKYDTAHVHTPADVL